MIEYYAVIGLACLDYDFLEKLENNKTNFSELGAILKDYGFRLSLYEIGEVQRLIESNEIVECMERIYFLEWDRSKLHPCLTTMTYNPLYRHPTFYLENKDDTDEKVIFAGVTDEVTHKAERVIAARELAESHARQEIVD